MYLTKGHNTPKSGAKLAIFRQIAHYYHKKMHPAHSHGIGTGLFLNLFNHVKSFSVLFSSLHESGNHHKRGITKSEFPYQKALPVPRQPWFGAAATVCHHCANRALR